MFNRCVYLVLGTITLFSQVAESLNNGLARTPPMGWSSWCTDDYCGLLDYCKEKEVKSVVDSMKENGMLEAGYDYVLLDDCWSSTERDSNGRVQGDPTHFPNGMKALADYVHDAGMKFGLYLCAGNLTCRHKRPGSWGYFDEDAQTMADWGVDMVKLDWCHHPSLPPNQVYGMFETALNKTGRPIFFDICEWGEADPWKWGAGVGNSWRAHADHFQAWHSSKLVSYSGPGGWNDADFLMTGLFPFTHTESVSEFSFWALFASNMIVATDVRNLGNGSQSKSEILLNKEVIEVSQDPLGIGGDRIRNSTDGTQVWARRLSDGSRAVILYNTHGIAHQHVTVKWSWIEASWSNATMSVRDLWAHKTVQNSSSYTELVAPHGVVMLRVRPVGTP